MRDVAKLEEISLLALALMLRRPADSELLDELIRQIKAAVAEVKPSHSPESIREEMRGAARACVKALQAAKEKRLPRHLQEAAHPPAASHPSPKPKTKPIHRPDPEEASNNRVARIVAAVAGVLVLAGGIGWWIGQDAQVTDSGDTEKFVEQIVKAVEGNAPPNHMFGGELKVISMGGMPVVTAAGVPPRICAASGMRLVRKGLLSVNGVTPTRVSSAIITELCNKEEGDASIMWAPK
ncbi:hypothetical protein [Paramagnetospirillum marisnigri]|uniref:hypothetical protein n=1 Tax=Paramagnetospirillum marisnigri TaxID=1285242 RepID=UPI001FE0FAB8|nr:hypothetical protein [Paramagnetospirillum marisnigri]